MKPRIYTLVLIIVIIVIALSVTFTKQNTPQEDCIEYGGTWNSERGICDLGTSVVEPPARLQNTN